MFSPESQLGNSMFGGQAEIVGSDIISHLVVRVTIDKEAVYAFIMTVSCHSPRTVRGRRQMICIPDIQRLHFNFHFFRRIVF